MIDHRARALEVNDATYAAWNAYVLTDDFIEIGVGFQLPKSAWLQRLTSGDLCYDRLELSEVTTRTYGSCAVTIALLVVADIKELPWPC